MNIIEINEFNYQAYTKLDIVAFSFAYEGAMGERGGIYIIDKDGQVYHANYWYGDNCIERKHIKCIIPVFTDLEFGLGCETNNDNWTSVYLGFGNSLLIIKEISDGFNKEIKKVDYDDSGALFQQWPGIVLKLLDKGNPNLTINDIWAIRDAVKSKLLPYERGGNFGYINHEGHIIIPNHFQFANGFFEGLAFVKDENGQMGFINEEGKWVIPCDKCIGAGDFHEGLAFVVNEANMWGFIDKAGNTIIPCQWKCADDFSEGFAAVQDETGKFGYINKQGELVIPCRYSKAEPFDLGLAMVQISEEEWTFIDTNGKPCPFVWAEVRPFSEGLAPVKNAEGLWGFVNKKWQVELDFQWNDAASFTEGLAVVSNGEKYGFINRQGEVAIPYQWILTGSFNEGLASVLGASGWGFVDREGNIVIPARYAMVSAFRNGIAFVGDAFSMEAGYIDRFGNLLTIQKDGSDAYHFDEVDDDFDIQEMKESVYKVGCCWEYIQDQSEIESENCKESAEFDEIAYVEITDRPTAQVCILRQGNKYGLYTADHTNGMGGPGTWCCSTINPFPYDEVKYCPFPSNYPNEFGLFAFRIGEKWGIIKVVDGSNEEEGIYDVEYPLTKRHIMVSCEYVALADAELQVGETYDWKDPFEEKEPPTDGSAKRDVKKGSGRDKIRVTFPDGMVIEDSVVWKTMAETIKRLGVKRVEKLKIPGIEKRNILLLDTHPTDDIIYEKSQKEIEPGYYLLTYNNTPQKAIYLEQISDRLHAHLKVELISY